MCIKKSRLIIKKMYLKYYVFLYFLNILLHKLIKINKRHNSLGIGILLKVKILVYCIITLKILDQPQNSYDRYRAPYETLYILFCLHATVATETRSD